MILVLDASAMVAFLRDESGAAVVESALLDDEAIAYAHRINVVEVFYDFHRSGGETAAQTALSQLENIGLRIVDDLGANLWQDAARLKSEWHRVSLADCFGVALTRQMNGEFLTADHHELDRLEAAQTANFTFIR